MRIERLEVKNFKGFEHKIIHFSPQFNVLMGNNGIGKTSLLDALAIGIGTLLHGFEGISSPPIKPQEIRHIGYKSEQNLELEPQYPTIVRCRGEINHSSLINWECELSQADSQTSYKKAQSLIDQAKQLQENVKADDKSLLPLLGYYNWNRLCEQQSEKVEMIKPNTRFSEYEACLEPIIDEKRLMHWFKTTEIAALQQHTSMNMLEGLRRAVKNCVEGCESIYYDIQHDTPIAILADEQFLPTQMLNEGQRIILTMVADIAYKAVSLNPQLENRAILETPGIVLIDEIDLHLHPNWQQRIVYKLRRTFPNIQFIVTTHSPFIIQSLSPTDLIYLDESWKPAGAEMTIY